MIEDDIDIINIQKNKILEFINDERYRSMKISELSFFMEVPEDERAVFNKIINELSKEGEFYLTSKGKITPFKRLGFFRGIYSETSKGYGFISSEEQVDEKIYISQANAHNAINKDYVFYCIVCKAKNSKLSEGEIVKIIERTNPQIVGTFKQTKRAVIVIPDSPKINKEISISKKTTKGAVNGQKVLVRLSETLSDNKNLEGEIVEILGHENDPGIDILSIVKEYNIPTNFDDDIYKEIENIPDEVLEQEIVGRNDFRNILMVTIDGEDTKDIDDAVSLEKMANGNFKLGVHIADVAHYVKEGSSLDKEALKRGTSVYLVDRVIPMLPHKLSNGICSLNANVDRLALSCVIEIDNKGMVVSHEISNSIINVDKRLTYTIVNNILANLEDSSFLDKYISLVPMFKEMGNLAAILREKRIKRGAIEFDFPETKIIVDSQGKVLEIKPTMRNVATGIIEEFMLICNETVSEEYFWLDIPFVYRTHEEPDSEKMKALNIFIHGFGYSLKGKSNYSRSIQALLSKIESTPEENIINRIVLRSFKQAKYTTENIGHFGLSAQYYSHFTSPIRRYPDLQIHRIIKKRLNGEIDNYINHLNKILPQVCSQCSITERTAESCERAVESLKKVEYMSDKIGQDFDGIISGVTNWGIYIEISNNVEGMVHLTTLDNDYYIFDKVNLMYIGERHGKTYRLGDKVRVSLIKVSIEERTIDFKILNREKIFNKLKK